MIRVTTRTPKGDGGFSISVKDVDDGVDLKFYGDGVLEIRDEDDQAVALFQHWSSAVRMKGRPSVPASLAKKQEEKKKVAA